MNNELAALATAVRDARRRRKWGQQDLADAAGVSLGVISNLERGLTHPQPLNEQAILSALELEKPDLADVEPDRRDWPSDVAVVLDVVGLVLSDIPEGAQRTQAIQALTRFVMGLPNGAAR